MFVGISVTMLVVVEVGLGAVLLLELVEVVVEDNVGGVCCWF